MKMQKFFISVVIVVAVLCAAPGSVMGTIIPHGDISYTYDVPLGTTGDRGDSSGDEMTDGVATSGGSAHADPNMVYWVSAAPQDDPVWDGPYPTATFDLGQTYSDLNSIQMWYGGWDAAGIGGPHGIKVSFSPDNVTYTTPTLYNSAPEGYPSNLNFSYHTATEPIGYNNDFRYAKIEFQPINDGSTQANF